MRILGKSEEVIRKKKKIPMTYAIGIFGAGDGNRTHAASLEGWNSTIELHPHTAIADKTALISYHNGKGLSRALRNFFRFFDFRAFLCGNP